jgi:hypothetical protein
MKLLDVHHDGGSKNYVLEKSGSERYSELILGKNWSKIMRIQLTISPIPLFRVDVPSSSQHIGFTTG